MFCLQLLKICNFTVLWMYGMSVFLFVQSRGVIGALPTVTAIHLHYIAMDIWTECSVVSRGLRENVVSVCGDCSTVTSMCYGYKE